MGRGKAGDVAEGAASVVGAPVAIGLLVLTEAAVPVGVPGDVLMLLVGERAAAGALSPWVAVVGLEAALVVGTVALFFALRGPARGILVRLGPRVGLTEERLGRARGLVERRGGRGLAVGRATPGLRTLTIVAASTAGLSPARALPALLLGSTVFVQAHFVLGYVFGPAVLEVFERAFPVALALAGLLLIVAVFVWLRRRGRGGGAQAFEEAGCPVCMVVGAVGDQLLAPRPASPAPG